MQSKVHVPTSYLFAAELPHVEVVRTARRRSTCGAIAEGRKMVKNKKPVRALLIIDVQNDFISGNLRVPDGKGVVPVFNRS